MDAHKFLIAYEHIANAPSGVARLRELILQFAVSGYLSERISGDVSARELLEKNEQTKKELVENRKLKRMHKMAAVSEEEAPWILPVDWCWTRLGNVTNYGDVPKVELVDVEPGTWVLELEDIEKSTSKLLRRVYARERKFKSSKNSFPTGSVLYGKLRPYLDKVLIADEAGVCSTEIMPISFYQGIDPRYLRWFLKSPKFISYANGSTYGMNLPRLGTESARFAPFPLPPEKEQAKIATKVDELMALCDQLEQNQKTRRSQQNATRKALLETVSRTSNVSVVLAGWSKLTEYFSDMFTSPEDVEDLRGLICDLAVRGLITEPVPEMESAEELLTKLEAFKLKLQSEGKTPRTKAIVPQSFKEAHFPSHWTVVSLNDAISEIDAGWSPACIPTPRRADTTWGVLKTTSVQKMSFNAKEHKELPSSLEPRPRYELRDGDILITRAGPKNRVGICCVAKNVPPRLMISDKLIRFHIAGDLISSDFVAMCITYGETGRILEGLKSGMADSQMNISQDKLRSLPIPVPPYEEQLVILERIDALMDTCDQLEEQLIREQRVSKVLAEACVASITGIAAIKEEADLKTPQTELIAQLQIGQKPSVKARAPLAAILVRQGGELSAKDLWQRFAGEIDDFYAQLKLEVSNGWIVEPQIAEMREQEAL